jgi:hypothetical protein
VLLSGERFEIVGVTGRDFFGVDVGESFDAILPLEAERLLNPARAWVESPDTWWLSIVGRLRPGLTVAEANSRLQVLGPPIFKASLPAGASETYAQRFLRLTFIAKPMPNGISWTWDRYRQAIGLIMAMAVTVLLVACTNLSNLLLARSAARRQEIATRLALGATRWRIVRQSLTESIVLCAGGTLLGLISARWGSQNVTFSICRPTTDS